MAQEKIKTFFLTSASPIVFRNFYFFDGGLYSQIKDHIRNGYKIRMVILVKPKDFKKYAHIFEDDMGGRIKYEEIPVRNPETVIEKAFRFFYSYLIYTGTTKLMATIGTRPDEPPAGGRAYLAPVKRFIANTFGRSVFFRDSIIPWLFLRLIRERPFKEVIRKYEPDLIFLSHIYGWFDIQLLAEAKRKNIPTIGMPAGWDHLDKYYLPFKVDKLLIQSPQMRDAAIEHQWYEPDKIQIVGHPHFDFIADPKNWISREKLIGLLGFPKDAKYILYVSGSAYCPDEPEIIEKIIKWADEGSLGQNVYMILRPYLGGRSKDREFDEAKFKGFRDNPRVRFYQKESWADVDGSSYYISLMLHADVLITVYSTAFLEASVLDRPSVAIAFDGNRIRPINRSMRRFAMMEHFQAVIKTGAMRTAWNFDELFTILKNYLDDPSLDSANREKLRHEFCYKLDRLASKRIVDAIFTKL